MYHTFQVGSDTFERGNSVQAHESGRHNNENCQSQRDQEESRGSGIVMADGFLFISCSYRSYIWQNVIIFIVLIRWLYLLAFMLNYTYLPSRAGRTTTPFGERSSRGIWSIPKTKRRRRIRLDLDKLVTSQKTRTKTARHPEQRTPLEESWRNETLICGRITS